MMTALNKLYMPQTYIITLLGLSLLIPPAFGTVTIQNSNFEFTDFNLNVTSPISVSSFLKEPGSFTTNNGELLREYSFDNASSVYNVHWDSIDATKAQFNITDAITDARGNVSNIILFDVELDDVSVPWTFTTLNIVDIDTADKVEYIFTGAPTTFNAIVITLNSPEADRLGGVFSIICPSNSTLTGVLTNGTFVCTDMSVFFP